MNALRAARIALGYMRAGADVTSARRLLMLRLRPAFTGNGDVVVVRARRLGGAEFCLRPGTSDIYAFGDDYVGHFNAPPPEVRGQDLRQILELGTNIGAGLADFARSYPSARIVGVEPDPANAALARRNTASWSERVTVVESAVWDSECKLTLEGQVEHGMTVRGSRPEDPPDGPSVAALPVSAILAEHMPEGGIDYVLLSAERSERRILTSNADWLGRVRAIRVETYVDGDYTPADTVRDLECAGFAARLDSDVFGASAVGVRRERPADPTG